MRHGHAIARRSGEEQKPVFASRDAFGGRPLLKELSAHLGLALGEDGALGVGPAQRVEQRHEGLVFGLLVKLQVDHRLCKLRAAQQPPNCQALVLCWHGGTCVSAGFAERCLALLTAQSCNATEAVGIKMWLTCRKAGGV